MAPYVSFIPVNNSSTPREKKRPPGAVETRGVSACYVTGRESGQHRRSWACISPVWRTPGAAGRGLHAPGATFTVESGHRGRRTNYAPHLSTSRDDSREVGYSSAVTPRASTEKAPKSKLYPRGQERGGERKKRRMLLLNVVKAFPEFPPQITSKKGSSKIFMREGKISSEFSGVLSGKHLWICPRIQPSCETVLRGKLFCHCCRLAFARVTETFVVRTRPRNRGVYFSFLYVDEKPVITTGNRLINYSSY